MKKRKNATLMFLMNFVLKQGKKLLYRLINLSQLKGQKMDINASKIRESFLFGIDSITYSTKSFSEFTEHAYGASNFSLISFQIMAFLSKKDYIVFNYLSDISVGAANKETLERILSLLENTTADEPPDLQSITYKDFVIVEGNGNTVANNGSIITVNSEALEAKKGSRAKQWIIAIMQNLAANGLWYLLCLAGGAIITWLITK